MQKQPPFLASKGLQVARMATVSLLLLRLLCLCCSVPFAQGIDPGVLGRITRKGLDYARQQGVTALQEELHKLALPDFSGSFKAPVIGKVDYRFSSLNIRHFQLPHSAIEPMPDPGLRVSISDAFAELTGKWEVKKRWLKDHGSFDLKVEGISISVDLKLGTDPAGRLTVTPLDCSTHISEVNIHISGRFRWLYNLFHRSIESAFRRAMEGQVCDLVRNAVSSRLQPYLHSLPVTVKVDNMAGIDYSLVGPPVATNYFVDVNLKAEFFSITHRSPAPFPPPALAFPADHDRMIISGISTYFFNTAGDVYYRAGAMTFWITDDMVPQEVKIRLNTSSFEAFIPQIKKLYPNTPMKLRVSPSSAPSLTITPESLSLAPLVDIQAFAVLPNSSLAPLFLMGASTTISAKVAVNSTRIFGTLKLGRLELSLKHSDVGTFSVQLFQALMNFFASNILVPQMNARLAEGFPLPLPDQLQLSNLTFQTHQDFLFLASDLHYG